MMKECRKRQVERRGDVVRHRCMNRQADAYRNTVDESVCNSCPVRVFIEQKKKPQPTAALPVIETGDYPSCEFRLRGPTCGVTGLSVDPEICGRCAKESKMETARLTDKVMNYAAAVRRWFAAGKPERTDAEIQQIYDDHCSKCSMFDKDRQVCNSCGCPASTTQPALRNKLRMATEECPLGQFPAKVKTNA